MRRRLVLAGAMAATSVFLIPVHAHAVALIAVGNGHGSNGPYNYFAVCNGQAGAATNLNQITFAVDAVGTATATKLGVVGVGTTVTCVIKDRFTGQVFGTIAAGDPGPEAVAAGLVGVPFNSSPEACPSGVGVFSDGGSAALTTC